MQAVCTYTPTPLLGELDVNELSCFPFLEIPDDIYQSLISPCSQDHFDDIIVSESTPDLSAGAYKFLDNSEKSQSSSNGLQDSLLVDSETVSQSSVSTEPLNDESFELALLETFESVPCEKLAKLEHDIEANSKIRKRPIASKQSVIQPYEIRGSLVKRRKASHNCFREDESDFVFSSPSTPLSQISSESYERKKTSNREAAHRYRQKIKMRAELLDEELEESFQRMDQAKQAYEKALESFSLLQKVVSDLTNI